MKACIFIKKSFHVNIAKFLKTAFLWKIFCLLWFYVMIEFFGRHWFYIACTLAVFLYNSSVRIETPYLFRTCFYINIFSKRNFRRHCNAGSNTILIKQLKIRNNCRTLATSPRNLLWKMWIWGVFLILPFTIIFFRSCPANMAKINPSEKQIDVEIQATLKRRPAS